MSEVVGMRGVLEIKSGLSVLGGSRSNSLAARCLRATYAYGNYDDVSVNRVKANDKCW